MRSDRIEPSSMPTKRPPETCDPASHDALARIPVPPRGRLAPRRRLRRCRTPIDSADAKCLDRWSGKRQSLRRPKRAARRWTCWPTLSRGQFSRGGRRGRVSGAWVGTRQAGRRYPCAAAFSRTAVGPSLHTSHHGARTQRTQLITVLNPRSRRDSRCCRLNCHLLMARDHVLVHQPAALATNR